MRTVFRQVNERIRVVSEQLFLATTADDLELLCECETAGCYERIRVPVALFDAIRTEAGTFVVSAGHAADDEVRETHDGYLVVAVPQAPAPEG